MKRVMIEAGWKIGLGTLLGFGCAVAVEGDAVLGLAFGFLTGVAFAIGTR